jgi:copper resistance protein C
MPALKFATAAIAATLLTAPLFAHARLMSTTPAISSTVKPTNKIEMRFSRKLVLKGSGADVGMTDMPGMKMSKPMKMAGTASLAPDGKTLVVSFKTPLPEGRYDVTWHIQSTDQHKMQGRFAFAVK